MYKDAYALKKSKLLRDFMLNFVAESGEIIWDAVVTFNSSEKRPKPLKKIETAKALS
ncbi:hypothetical protein HNQ59_001081 [Chitinivorax tropicus]|uniref:Uncharacterized protein n=1 Tax=Chitinivorax tropicus TaxID=714531 RepID=A0A840MRG8_9PROT|nr:hypothetical protein [Chitinivorax tropicus]